MVNLLWYSALITFLLVGSGVASVYYTRATAKWPYNEIKPKASFLLVTLISFGIVVGGLIG